VLSQGEKKKRDREKHAPGKGQTREKWGGSYESRNKKKVQGGARVQYLGQTLTSICKFECMRERENKVEKRQADREIAGPLYRISTAQRVKTAKEGLL